MSIGRVAIVGPGFMGTGIAQAAASAGVEVTLYHPQSAALEGSRVRLMASLDRALSRGKLTSESADALVGRISYVTSFDGLAGAEAVIEAVDEVPELKGEIFRMIDQHVPDATFLASNTSSIPIAEVAAHTTRPDRVVGLHFFSPVPVMQLVEVVVGLGSSPEAVTAAETFARQIGKQPIFAKDRSGFVVNRLLIPYLMAAVRMYEEGFASREDIDTGMQLGCGHPMGPLTLCDFIGLDVLDAIGESLYREFRQPEYASPPLLKRMVVAGNHGRKTGRGFYDY